MKNIKNIEYKIRTFEGITLISLIITIILLIILAGIGISLSLGGNGIFNKAKYAKEKYINSMEKEQEQLNDAYGQMLVATGEDSTVTITMKQLNDLIDERISKKLYIDTSKSIAEIPLDTEYEATKDCIIVAKLSTVSRSSIDVKIDDVIIGNFTNNNSAGIIVPLCYNLKAGQKIIFVSNGSQCYGSARVYETL